MRQAAFEFQQEEQVTRLSLSGCWQRQQAPTGDALLAALPKGTRSLRLHTDQLDRWDGSLPAALFALVQHCEQQSIPVDSQSAPPSLQQLLTLAMGVTREEAQAPDQPGLKARWINATVATGHIIQEQLVFLGDLTLAFGRWLRGGAKTRAQDIRFCINQAGPAGLGIIALIALLVGMILAYLGSIQLRQWGAQVYVADLVALGMVREMGALMTAVIMAGRTGAAYAAQLGTMQVNDEVDALRVMGISSMEFLILPRVLALVFVMPLLCIYADIIGIAGGALVAATMDVSFVQYLQQTQNAVDWLDIFTGLIKSVCFGLLIAIAGCQAGITCGRDSNAVGLATTQAVVRAIIYLVVADAAFNILYDKLGI